jgi:hemoglobin
MNFASFLGWFTLAALGVLNLLAVLRLNERLTAALLTRSLAQPAAPRTDVAGPDPIISGPPQVPSSSGEVDNVRDFLLHHTRGRYTWADAVSRFYDRAAGDPQIASYFHGVDMPELQRHFTAAIGIVTSKGLTARTLIRMAEVHDRVHDRDGRPITGEVYDRTVGILIGVLVEMGVPRRAVEELGDVVAPLRRAIVGEP